jgi:CheY-like chemotaxis protein
MSHSTQERRQSLPTPSNASSPRPVRRPRILVVDDTISFRTLMDEGLRSFGFDVYLAAGGLEALEIYKRHGGDIALVLLDVCMPGLDGPQTLASLQQLNTEVVCCFMDRRNGTYTERQLLQLGAARLLRKPFLLTEVRRVFQMLVSDREP